MALPDFKIETIQNWHVLRDDYIAGGTKRRSLEILVAHQPHQHFTYAGTILGHGALALALACQNHGKTAHLYISSNDPSHPMLGKLAKAGAIIKLCAPLPVSTLYEQSKAFASESGAYPFPLAFDEALFYKAMLHELQKLDVSRYSEIWCVTVSGTFAKSLESAFPDKQVITVSVATSTPADFLAPEKYHRPAVSLPPYPACPYTDAKLWQFARRHAMPDALIWNIAG